MDLLGALQYIPAFFKSWAITLTGSRLIVHLEPLWRGYGTPHSKDSLTL
jgi:hypothetical protein